MISRAGDSYDCPPDASIPKFVTPADTSLISRTVQALENILELILLSETRITMDVQLSLLSTDSPMFDTHRYVGALLGRGGNIPIFKRKTQQGVPMACSGLLTRQDGSQKFRKARGEN